MAHVEHPPHPDKDVQKDKKSKYNTASQEITLPTEEYKIAPEALAIAQSYLEHQDLHKVAVALDVPRDQVAFFLDKREVRKFIDSVFMQQGYMHRHKLQDLMTDVIDAKLQEMDESEMASTKDIADLIALQHKMRMDELNLQLKVEAARNPSNGKNVPGKQVNIQNNFGENYNHLLDKLTNR